MIHRLVLITAILLTLGCTQKSTSITQEQALSEEARQALQIIPLPYSTILEQEEYRFTNNIKWSFDGPTDHVLKQAFNTTTDWLNDLGLSNGTATWDITITTQYSAPAHPYVGIDESYQLTIRENAIDITATNGIGAAYALQTLRQLINKVGSSATVPGVSIDDQPRYPWRGLMIDVSRHFIPMDILYNNIDAMSMFKMNTLHLHLTDNQGFRIESKAHPKLHEIGSGGKYYKQKEMKELIQYAAARGIRIVPEFDLPGHASAWLAAYPEFGSRPGAYQLQTTYGTYKDAIDPTNQELYIFLAGFIKEMAALFPDEYIHIGSDEVIPQDWADNERINDFIASKKLNGYQDLQTYFNLRLVDLTQRAGKKMIAWDEALHPETAKSGITIQAWRSQDAVYESAMMGSKAIASHGWYLNHKLPISELYNVDPQQEPSYMNFDPDRSNWAAYEIASDHPVVSQKGMLFTFGTEEAMTGHLNIMGKKHIIPEILWDGGQMVFEFKNTSGPMRIQLNTADKEMMSGSLNISFMGIPITAKKIGGSSMESGIVLPKFSKPEPPTSAQLDKILGGEAAMWTEWADGSNINSRIWPRTLAIAEKLWSPMAFTQDVDDIYRRSKVATQHLSAIGVIDDRHQLRVMSQWSTNVDILRNLYSLIELLEESKYYNRWSAHPNHTTTTKFDRVADIVPAESIDGYDFNHLIAEFIEDRQDEQRIDIIKKIANWATIYDQLKDLIQDHPQLGSVEYHCLVLSDLSKIALTLSTGTPLTTKEIDYINRVKENGHLPRGGTTLSVLPGLIKFIDLHINPS